MIAPGQDEPAWTGGDDLEGRVRRFFAPDGDLDAACVDSDFPYEPRPQQQEMADEICRALDDRHHLVVEAGTGVGKSFAYLVPMVLKAVRDRVRVVVSTHTISLQEQLIMKDLPFLQRHLGVPFKAVLVKGRGNYLCLRRLERAKTMEGELFATGKAAELDAVTAWAGTTQEGSIQDMQREPSHEVWDAVCAEQGNCLWQRCPEFEQCFFMKARQEMVDADVLVVNHHLFFSDLAIRAAGAGLLPDYAHVVLDEAHTVEPVASDHLGIRLSQYGVEYWLRRLYSPDRNKGILAVMKASAAAHEVTRLWESMRQFFAAIHRWAELSDSKTQQVVEKPLTIDSDFAHQLRRTCRVLAELSETLEEGGIRAELDSLHRRGVQLVHSLDSFLSLGCDDHVYWVELSGKRMSNIVLFSAPIDVRGPLKELIFDPIETAVLTSATLACGDDMKYFQHRVGADDAVSLKLGSPFDFARQMRVTIPAYLPEPTDRRGFPRACAKACTAFAASTGGRSFVLFTSRQLMREVAALARPQLSEVGLSLLVQDEGLGKQPMLKRFVEEGSSVLFGLDSFWTGIDVRGDALTNVMITRLPFAVPDQPLIKARMDRITAQGGNAFRDYSLPEAILRFRQGVGRLIRTATDEGMIVVLDNRIVRKSYGRLFLNAIPECPVEIVESE